MENNWLNIITTIIAVLAFLQPWAIKIFNCYFRKLELKFLPSTKIKIYYNRSGAYIYLGGVLESKNHSSVINNVSVKIIRNNDKAELNLIWSSFIVPVFQSIAGNAITTSEIARPFKVEANSLYPVFIEFDLVDEDERDKLLDIYNQMGVEINQNVQSETTSMKLKETIKETSLYKESREKLLSNFYWKETNYTLELVINYNDNKQKKYIYKFQITSDEHEKLKENIEKSLLSIIDEAYRIPLNLFCLQKDFHFIEERTN